LENLFELLGIAIVLFTSTNIDDVFVLLGFFADPQFRTRQVIIGQYLGITALFGVSALASLISLVIPAAYIGLLGFAPIFRGPRGYGSCAWAALYRITKPGLLEAGI
jgi:cadmium resistance protein CadD (predicted permease)